MLTGCTTLWMIISQEKKTMIEKKYFLMKFLEVEIQ